MKKALSLLLALAMLASLCTVPAWAAEDVEFDIPVIEEVTEEELAEVELFAEEVELYADGATNIDGITYGTYESADGVTYLNALTGAVVTQVSTGTGEDGILETVYNGIYTEGVKDADGNASANNEFPEVNGTKEGFMGNINDTVLQIDLGSDMTFSGIRLADDAKARGMKARKASEINIEVSSDGNNWGKLDSVEITRTAEITPQYGDFAFTFDGEAVNVTARYIKFGVSAVKVTGGSNHAQFDIEEIIMLNEDAGNETVIPSEIYDFYLPSADWTWDAVVWGPGTPLTNLYNGIKEGDQEACWHSPTELTTTEDAPITVMFDEPIEIGGVRLYPRTVGGGASPKVISLQGTYDGENWVDVAKNVDAGTNWEKKIPGNVYLKPGRNNTFKGIRVIINQNVHSDTKKWTCFTELEMLKPVSGVLEFPEDEVDISYPVIFTADAGVSTYRVKADGTAVKYTDANAVNGTINDGIALTGDYLQAYVDKTGKTEDQAGRVFQAVYDYSIFGDNASTNASDDPFKYKKTYVDYDLGHVEEFSGVRLYGRENIAAYFTKGNIYVSKDGTNWIAADTLTAASARSTPLPIKFDGTAYNVEARYIRVECTATNSGHWGLEEIRLLKPVSGNVKKDVDGLIALFRPQAEAVETLITAIPESTTGVSEEVVKARAAYDALSAAEKTLVSAELLAKLEAAEAAVADFVATMNVTNRAETLSGVRIISFTVPKTPSVTVTSATYDSTLDTEIDGTYAVSAVANEDGTTMTVTMGGNYGKGTGAAAIVYGETTTFYEDNSEYGWKKDEPMNDQSFHGRFVRMVTNDGIGDHIIKVTFGEGEEAVTYNFNIKTTSNWLTLSSAKPITGSEYTDEITPKTTWKVTATNRKYTDLSASFDGKAEYLIRKGGDNKTTNRYESDYVEGKYTQTDGTGRNDVLCYPPSRMDFIIDTVSGEEIAGVRIYPRVSSFNENKASGTTAGAPTKIRYWGSDDLVNWDNLGDYTFGTTLDEKTAMFEENAEYRYYKGSISESNGLSYSTISLSEIVLLKPITRLTSDSELTIDVSEAGEAEFTFVVLAGDDLASVKDSEGTNLQETAYTFENGTLTINKEYLLTLADGTHTFTVTFNGGQSFDLKVKKTDSSSIVYKVFSTTEAGNDNGSDALVLEKANGAAVTKVEINGKDIKSSCTISADNKTITIPRNIFRQSADLFALIDAEENGHIQVVVTYEGGEKTYDITLVADWGAVLAPSESALAEFEEDEIITKATWKARVSSAQNQHQPGNVLSNKAIHTRDRQNWHTEFGSGAESTVAQGHYFEIDFGENPDPYSGFRLVQRPSGTHWANVIITAKNSGDATWTEIYNGSPKHEQIINEETKDTHDGAFPFTDTSDTDGDGDKTETLYAKAYKADILLDANQNYRYVRIHIVQQSTSHVTADTLHVLKARTILTSDAAVTIDASEVSGAEFTFVLADGDAFASLKNGETVLENSAYSFENGTLTINKEYLLSLADGTHTLTATFTGGQSFTLTVVKTDTSKVSYILAGTTSATTTGALVLTNPTGKEVAELVVEGGTVLPFTASDDNKTLTVARPDFRHSADLYSLMNVNSAGELTVTAKDSAGDVVKEYTVMVNSEWAEIPTVTRTEFAYDEINPSGQGWKVRTSSMRGSEHPANAFAKPVQYGYQSSYWHTGYVSNPSVIGDSTKAMGTYLEIDFGANVPVYSGLRHVERIAGTTWNAEVTVWGKNDATGAWDNIIYQGTPTYKSLGSYTVTQGTFNLNCADMIFESAGYRYLRIKITSASEHITANTLTVLKPTARLEGDDSVISYTDEEKTAEFTFALPENAAGEISVKAGETAVAPENYTFEEGVLSFAATYVNGLSEGENTLTVTIDGMPITVTIVRKDRYTLSYVLSASNDARGTEELVLSVKEGYTVAAVEYNGKTVPYTLNEDGNIVISRPTFRNLDDMFDMDSLELKVTFGEGEGTVEKTYTINLTKGTFTVTGVVADNFIAEEEIVPVNGKWQVTVISANNDGNAPNRMLAKSATHLAWHTGYSGDGVGDIISGRHYLDIDFGEETTFAGFRYYARTEERETDKSGYDNSGVWHGATIYGRNADTEEWTLIKSQAFDTRDYDKASPDVNKESIYATRVATVYFGEDVTYKQVRIAIDSYPHSTAKALTFLLPRVKAPVPEDSEGDVNIKVTPTTGGNVTVNEAPTLGDNYVASNTNVTFIANSNVAGGFKYWIEANTGKILGTESTLTIKSAIGKDIKAVFADPSTHEAFVSFYGLNGDKILATSYVKKGDKAVAPSNDKLYSTGYKFMNWADKSGIALDPDDTIIEGNTDFYAQYEKKEAEARMSYITVEGGTIAAAVSGDAGTATGTFPYDTRVCATATVPDDKNFSHWTLDGEIVSYDSSYIFYAPDAEITLVANFVEGTTVEKEVNITITQTFDEINGVKVAGFITTRYVPEGTKVIETGVIYVKDASYGDLTIADVGKTSDNGKAVKVAFASANGKDGEGNPAIVSGQYKLSAGYAENLGIKAVGFITYELELEDGSKALKTIYTDVKTVEAVTE